MNKGKEFENLIFFFKQKTAYEITRWLEFRRVLFRSNPESGLTLGWGRGGWRSLLKSLRVYSGTRLIGEDWNWWSLSRDISSIFEVRLLSEPVRSYSVCFIACISCFTADYVFKVWSWEYLASILSQHTFKYFLRIIWWKIPGGPLPLISWFNARWS